jgi:hypothetical protein
VREQGDSEHILTDRLEDVRFFAIANHVGVSVERQVFHHIKHEEVEPLCDIDWLFVISLEHVKQFADGFCDAMVVPHKCCSTTIVSICSFCACASTELLC